MTPSSASSARSAGVVADPLISVQPVKVIVPEIPVRHAMAKDVPRGVGSLADRIR